MVEKYEAKSDEYIEKNVKNQKVDSTFSDLKTESKSAFIESLKAFQAQNPNFLSNIVNKELSRKYWAYGIIAKGEDKYEMKYVPEDFDRYDQGFFGRAKPEYIIVKGECLEKLKQQGYEMDCWQKGIPLAINNKHPDSIKLKGF